jgi:chaperonin GroES
MGTTKEKATTKKKDAPEKKLDLFKVKPVRDGLIVLPHPAEQVSKGGIIIPDTAKEKPKSGTVVNHGPGVWEDGNHIKPEVKTGDEIIYGTWAGVELHVDGVTYLVMKQSDVLAII